MKVSHYLPYLLFASLFIASCDHPPSDQQQVQTDTHELTIPPMALNDTQMPDLGDIENGWFYQPGDHEDPYSPDEALPVPIEPEPPLTFAEELARAALARTMHRVRYDGRYLKIAYPMGDVPADMGVCTDVVIRSYRELGIDLQEEVHKDIRKHFRKYPSRKRWGLRKPDTNIDHRRVYNLQTFFDRKGESLPISDDPANYKPGDLVTWQVTPKLPHIGVVLEMVSDEDPNRHLIAHNIGSGPVIDDMLFDFKITGHYRYHPEKRVSNVSNKDDRDLGKT